MSAQGWSKDLHQGEEDGLLARVGACHLSPRWSLREDRTGGASEDARLADQSGLRVIANSGRARPGRLAAGALHGATWASVMLTRRVPLKVVSDLLGDSSIAISRRHLRPRLA